jgi:hypothetical protein
MGSFGIAIEDYTSLAVAANERERAARAGRLATAAGAQSPSLSRLR